MQYLILVEKYRTFCEKISESLSADGKAKDAGKAITYNKENFESVKGEIENIQMKIKELCDFISKKAKQIKSKGSMIGIKSGPSTTMDNTGNLPNIDKEYLEKSDKIRVNDLF